MTIYFCLFVGFFLFARPYIYIYVIVMQMSYVSDNYVVILKSINIVYRKTTKL